MSDEDLRLLEFRLNLLQQHSAERVDRMMKFNYSENWRGFYEFQNFMFHILNEIRDQFNIKAYVYKPFDDNK